MFNIMIFAAILPYLKGALVVAGLLIAGLGLANLSPAFRNGNRGTELTSSSTGTPSQGVPSQGSQATVPALAMHA